MYRLVSGLQDEDLRRIETSLSERFDVFETMLRSENRAQHRGHGEGAAADRGPTWPAPAAPLPI